MEPEPGSAQVASSPAKEVRCTCHAPLWHSVENGYTCAMARPHKDKWRRIALWQARLAVGVVFLLNVNCALVLVIHPARYSPGFEVSGVPGEVLVRGMGILFLMWNATYPPVLARPDRHQALFGVILAQQAIGLAGEICRYTA